MRKRVRLMGEIPLETRVEQAKASDPSKSVWASANAGSGKTHVLSERVIRLLLNDVEPSCIICLTYTKAAAAVMANRVFEKLAAWVALDDAALADAITKMGEPAPAPRKLRKARRLFARALETPGGLRIQTIHAFCQSVLARFPLEANIAGRFELMDDDLAAHFLKDAKRRVLEKGESGEFGRTVAKLVGAAGEHALESLIEECLKSRDRVGITAFSQAISDTQNGGASLYDFMGLAQSETEESVALSAWPLKCWPLAVFDSVSAAASASSLKTQRTFAAQLNEVLTETSPALRLDKLRAVALTQKGEFRGVKELVKKDLLDAFPDIENMLVSLFDEISGVFDKLARIRSARLTLQGFQIAGEALREYAALKARRAMLDYDDIIHRTAKLLTQPGAGGWVQYKLDQSIGHLLIDEAQDTNPAQWTIIKALSEEFFAGEGAAKAARTLFAVGDEKQSIYSFQGARPEVFGETGRQTRRRAGGLFDEARLNLSFRSTADVLRAVDSVFSLDDNRRGLSPTNDYQRHETIRIDGPGRVEVWPLLLKEKAGEIPEDWTEGVRHEAEPAVRLAAAIANTIEDWISNRAINSATGHPIEARDIMVLARKRGRFVHALSRELKNRNIAVSGADRLVLTSHIAAKDLLAIARFCLMPGDDLSLAALLRSPLFALTDPELLELAAHRKPGEPLFARMQAFSAMHPKCAAAFAELEGWRKDAARLSVFDFYARILGRDQVRARLIQRLGIEAGDVIDEFLNYALASERAGLSGLQDFVETLESAAPEIKREMSDERDEVRIMTAHAAKGQEAPIVFLVDPVSANTRAPALINISNGGPMFIWEPSNDYRSSKTASARAVLKQREEEEFRRLLYVGMTRAEDQLIVCGFGNAKTSEKSASWVSMVQRGLGGSAHLTHAFQPHYGGEILVWQTGTKATPTPEDASETRAAFAPLLSSFLAPLPPVRLVPRPLSPSGASLVIEPDAPASAASPVLDKGGTPPSDAILRGLITHKLLESLPGLPRESRRLVASRYVNKAAADWTETRKATVVADVLHVLEDVRFQSAFAAVSRAEVSVMGQVKVRGETRMVSGKIDRIAVEESRVLLVDFKTDYTPAHSAADVPDSYLTQMALYRAILQPLYPGKAVECALLYTGGARLIALPPERMDAALEALANS